MFFFKKKKRLAPPIPDDLKLEPFLVSRCGDHGWPRICPVNSNRLAPYLPRLGSTGNDTFYVNKVNTIKLKLFKKRRRKKYKKLMFRMIKLISRHKSKDQHMEVSNTPIKLNIKTVRLCNCKKKEILLKYKIKESIFKRQHKFFNRDLMIKFNLEDKLYFCNNKHKITMKKAS